MLLYSVDWSKACISFIFLTVNLFRNCTLSECEVYHHFIVYCIHYKLTCVFFVTVKLNFLQLKAFNYYKKNCMSIEVVKEDELQKVNFRVKSKVRQNEGINTCLL